MSFLFPLGFLALIGVPVLILIYIIKNRYTEQTVSSTYLWTLSERFLKRRIPINRITGILSLLLQILAVVCVAIVLAHPIISVPGSAEAYLFIIDGSGSMNIMRDGKTRFDAGKEEIIKIIDDSMLGSTYTYVCAGDTTATIFEEDNDKDRAMNLVRNSSASYTTSALTDALGTAQEYFDYYPFAKIYLVTDKNYESAENVQIINVATPAENFGLSEVEQDIGEGKISGDVIYYGSAADPEVSVNIYYDGNTQESGTITAKCKTPEEANPAYAAGRYALQQATIDGVTHTSGDVFESEKLNWQGFRLTTDGNIIKNGGQAGTWRQTQDVVTLQYSGGNNVTATMGDNTITFRDGRNQFVLEKEKSFSLVYGDKAFASATVRIARDDALGLDNETVIYKVENQNMAKTLLVSDSPFFAENLLNSVGIYDRGESENGEEDAGEDLLDVVATKAYAGEGGYGLYIFDSFTPPEMPKEGAVWIVNPQSNITYSNFSYQGETVVDGAIAATFPPEAGRNSTVKEQLGGLDTSRGFHLNKYAKLSVSGRYYELASCEGNPIIFTGTNGYGNREVVFAFDFRASADLVMSGNMVLLLSNLVSYSFPEVLNKTTYYCGDTLLVNMIADCKSIRIETPLGHKAYPDTTSSVSEYLLEEVGTYKVFLIMKDETERMVNVYSLMPEEERNPSDTAVGLTFNVTGTPEESDMVGLIDNLLIIFIILAVIVVADYGVYCYEQYQLR